MVPVTLTEVAKKEIKVIIENKSIPTDYSLRIGVKNASGCSGVNYLIGFDEKSESDELYDLEGIPVIIARKDMMHVMGLTVDFSDEATERGFVFRNDV